jgi:uncharacterized protein (DUF2141 family)
MKAVVAITALGLLAVAQAAPGLATLTVEVRHLETNSGELRFALFDNEDDFLERPVRAGVVPVADHGASWIAADLPYGTYAVIVHHDVNGNGEMEQHWYGKPKEPVGASNNPGTRFGPPRFEKSKFDLRSERLTVYITVR